MIVFSRFNRPNGGQGGGRSRQLGLQAYYTPFPTQVGPAAALYQPYPPGARGIPAQRISVAPFSSVLVNEGDRGIPDDRNVPSSMIPAAPAGAPSGNAFPLVAAAVAAGAIFTALVS